MATVPARAAAAASARAAAAAREQKQSQLLHHRWQTETFAPLPSAPLPSALLPSVGEKVFIHDGETAVPAYDTPRFAPLRALLDHLALQRTIISWSERYHVAIPSDGPGNPAFTIWIKKNASAWTTPDVYFANFCFRFDSSNSSSGFSIEALRAKLGYTTCADAGLEWLIVADSSFHTGPTVTDDDETDRQLIIAVRNDASFNVDLWLYLEDVGKVWGRFPKAPSVDSSKDSAEAEDDEQQGDRVEGTVVETSEESGEVPPSPALAALPHPNPRPNPNPNQDGAEDGAEWGEGEVEARPVDEGEEDVPATEEAEGEAEDDAAAAVSWAELPLHSVALKITGVLYALSGGRAAVSIARDDLMQPLKHLGVGNVVNALQSKRVSMHTSWFTHNGKRGNKARLQLAVGGVEIIKNMYSDDHARLSVMMSTIVCTNPKALVLGGPTAGPAPAPLPRTRVPPTQQQQPLPPALPTPPPAPPPSSTPPAPQSPSTPPGAPPLSSGFVISCPVDEIKRALDQLDAAIANAADVAKRLRSLVDR